MNAAPILHEFIIHNIYRFIFHGLYFTVYCSRFIFHCLVYGLSFFMVLVLFSLAGFSHWVYCVRPAGVHVFLRFLAVYRTFDRIAAREEVLFYHSLFAYFYGHWPLAWHCRVFTSIVGSAFFCCSSDNNTIIFIFFIITFNRRFGVGGE